MTLPFEGHTLQLPRNKMFTNLYTFQQIRELTPTPLSDLFQN